MANLQFKIGGMKVNISSKGVLIGGKVCGFNVSKRVVSTTSAKKVKK